MIRDNKDILIEKKREREREKKKEKMFVDTNGWKLMTKTKLWVLVPVSNYQQCSENTSRRVVLANSQQSASESGM